MRRAVILAGGLGTRLGPYTTILPKPLMPVGDRPILDIVIRQLARAGFDRVTIATGYLAELIEAFFSDGSVYGVPIDYFREDEPLGTVGALSADRRPRRGLPGHERRRADRSRLPRLLDDHRAGDQAATIAAHDGTSDLAWRDALRRRADPTRVTDYIEKPTLDLRGVDGRLLLRAAGTE